MSLQEKFKIDMFYVINKVSDFLGISESQVPIFIFFLVVLIITQIIGARANKPIINTLSLTVFVLIVFYWKFFT